MQTDTRSPDDLRKRRLESAKGEASRFLEAVASTKDPDVRRTWRGLVASVHKVFFTDEN